MQALLIAVSSCVAYPIVLLVMRLNLLSPPSVSRTVGYASYAGYPKANEYLSSLMVMLVCICLGYAFARFAGKSEEKLEAPVMASRRWNVRLVHTTVLGLLLLQFWPDFRVAFNSMGSTVYQYRGWDDASPCTGSI